MSLRAAPRAGPSRRTRTPCRRSSVGLVADRRFEESEEPDHLVIRAGPVLAAEGVQGQDRDAPPDRVAEELADRLDPGRVPFELGEAALTGPAAIAVHDDGHMAGQVGRRRGGVRLGRRRVRTIAPAAPAAAAAPAAGAWAIGGASVGRASGTRTSGRPTRPP